MTRSRSSFFPSVAAVLAVTVLASACVQVPNADFPSATGAPMGDQPRDRVTASDETKDARRARVRMELASAYYRRGQFTTALDEIKLALQADPSMSDGYVLRGLIYSALGDDGLAEDSYRRALSLDPRDADAMHNYGWHLCARKRFDEAEAQFTQALAVPQYTGTSRTLLAAGVCQTRAGRLPEAEATLRRAYELEPGNPMIAVNYAEALYLRGDYERARFYVRRVNQSEASSNAQTLWLAARIEMKLGNQQGANDFGFKLRNRFPKSRESLAFDRGAFNE